MRGRVQMRAVMFERPETSREISVAFDGCIWKYFKSFFVTRPRRQMIVDGVSEIDDARAAVRKLSERF